MRRSLIVFLTGLAIRLLFIHFYPQIFGGDSLLRISNRNNILMSYQLPLLQSIIYTVSKAGGELAAIRLTMALIGALAGVGFYFLMRHFTSESCAFLAALLFATNPFFMQLTIVPYQEVLMLGLLFFAFHFYFDERVIAASLCLGLACLTRYEAWAACPVIVLAELYRRGISLRPFLVYGWAPAAWLILHRGLSSEATFVAEAPRSLERFWRYIYLGWIVLNNLQPPAFVLAFGGIYALWKDQAWRKTNVQVVVAFVLLFALSIPFSAHGESPNPERFVTGRTAAILIASLVLLAGVGIARMQRLGLALAIAGIIWGVWMGNRFLLRDTSQPTIQLSYRLARFLDSSMEPSDRALILTSEPSLDLYLKKVREREGERGIQIAMEKMRHIDTTPPDFQRTVVHSHLSRDRFLSIQSEGNAQWVAVWSNFKPTNEWTQRMLNAVAGIAPATVLESGPLSVRVYRLR